MDEPQNVLALPQAPDAIELRHLRAFVAVADDLSFSRAAQRLFISQPALSRQIRGLERLVGCDLFRRSTQRVELTLAGEALLARARALLADLDDAISVTRSVGGELAGRMALLWEPWARASAEVADLDGIRAALEDLHGKFTPPPDVAVAPVIAGGVPALRITPETASPAPATVLFLHGGGHVAGSAFGYRHLAAAHRHRGSGTRAGHRLPAGPRAPLSRLRAGRGQRLPVAARHRRRPGQDRRGRRLVSGRAGHVRAAGAARA
jgi:DNA-binding transcriptional LysR family regulator